MDNTQKQTFPNYGLALILTLIAIFYGAIGDGIAGGIAGLMAIVVGIPLLK